MSDLPFDLDAGLADRLARALDREAKIPRALDALGPVAGRDVVLLDGLDGLRAAQLRALGARILTDPTPGLADVVIGLWSALRGADPAEIAAAEVDLTKAYGGDSDLSGVEWRILAKQSF